ncbi:cell division protein ZapA [Desulfobulbus alkaliphilus]|uniref:cell division protein ZapA n=1 Tax=Desulfobulbus alkaliphilus TaxID=869814 RepID=UPI001965C057|nr:cell division protein ZapA [Desulfobulbus alkaliphilus]MBM9537337.1 cell division protein ZapA [Desulfobulbus alkaliphilus]
MQDRLVRFHLFGQEFTFYSDAPEDEVEAVLQLLRDELEANEKVSRSSVPSSKVLVLGCLRMAAKYMQVHQEYQEYRHLQERTVDRLIDKISSGMD